MAPQYSSPPPMAIDVKKSYQARFLMEGGGEFLVDLFEKEAPRTVNNFVFLCRDGFYDGVTFHRVIPGFMAQAGDPKGTGSGGPGYTFQDEFQASLRHDRQGILSMANSGPNTNGSQFFIIFTPTLHLDGKHSVFGVVTEGMDVVNAITTRDPARATSPGDRIQSITIDEA
jgi:cyclophilin family peptidyl-prolyl cis-trans isomerase